MYFVICGGGGGGGEDEELAGIRFGADWYLVLGYGELDCFSLFL